jgi:CHAD domain-containing protein
VTELAHRAVAPERVEPPGAEVPRSSSGVWCETGSARAAITAAIGASVERLVVELPRARMGEDPEGVHQARVATRRLRSDLRTFAPLLDDEWRRRTRAELRWLADALGAARDADVLGERLRSAIDLVDVDPDAAATLLAVLREQGGRARRVLVAALDDERTVALLADLRVAAADPPTTLSALGHADRRLRPLVRRPWRKLTRAVRALDDDPAVADLHRVRLLAKRTRYASEAVVDVYGREARRFAAAVAGIQDVLGELNDAEAAIAWLHRTAVDLEWGPAFAAGELTHHCRGVADSHHHGWERSYRRARKRSAWLA